MNILLYGEKFKVNSLPKRNINSKKQKKQKHKSLAFMFKKRNAKMNRNIDGYGLTY